MLEDKAGVVFGHPCNGMVGLILEEARRIYFAHAAGAFPWIAKREALFVGAFAVNEVVHSFRPFVIHPGGAVDRHSTDYKMKSILHVK